LSASVVSLEGRHLPVRILAVGALVLRTLRVPLVVGSAVPTGVSIVLVGVGLREHSAALVGLGSDVALVVWVGFCGSVVCHELGHAVALSLCPGVSRVRVAWSLTRVSVHPTGTLTPTHAVMAALAGPVPCVAVGLMAGNLGYEVVGGMYLLHGLYLLPPFGDGRSVVRALRGRAAR
jgi:hypothetical protein